MRRETDDMRDLRRAKDLVREKVALYRRLLGPDVIVDEAAPVERQDDWLYVRLLGNPFAIPVPTCALS